MKYLTREEARKLKYNVELNKYSFSSYLEDLQNRGYDCGDLEGLIFRYKELTKLAQSRREGLNQKELDLSKKLKIRIIAKFKIIIDRVEEPALL